MPGVFRQMRRAAELRHEREGLARSLEAERGKRDELRQQHATTIEHLRRALTLRPGSPWAPP